MPERDVWEGCYRDSWGKSLQPESFSHPAKCSRGLARRIYQHASEEGWLSPGAVVLDPFSGIGGFACDALRLGLTFIGIELERPFVDMAQGCDCTGVTKADWVRFYGRLDHVRHKDGRYICPRCIAEAKGVLPAKTAQVDLFADTRQSLSYRRDSGQIPHTEPHHYVGNLEAWAKMGLPGEAVVLQGDSRKLLCWGFAGTGADLVCGSPPFAQSIGKGGETKGFHSYDQDEAYNRCKRDYMISSSPANLGNMKAGEPPSVIISSPPFAGAQQTDRRGLENPFQTDRVGSQPGRKPTQYLNPDSPGQLGQMREEDVAAVIGSPPFHSQEPSHAQGNSPSDIRMKAGSIRGRSFAESSYGNTPGQLASLPPGSLADVVPSMVISSPPYAETMSDPHDGIKWRQAKTEGGSENHQKRGRSICGEYGRSEGQVGNSSGDTFWGSARMILEQVYLLLRPGGHAIWVCGDYIRNGKRVRFSEQWAALCESVGFRWIHWHHCPKVERYGTQVNLEGEEEVDEVSRVSFFRHLSNAKGGEKIESEECLCFVKE